MLSTLMYLLSKARDNLTVELYSSIKRTLHKIKGADSKIAKRHVVNLITNFLKKPGNDKDSMKHLLARIADDKDMPEKVRKKAFDKLCELMRYDEKGHDKELPEKLLREVITESGCYNLAFEHFPDLTNDNVLLDNAAKRAYDEHDLKRLSKLLTKTEKAHAYVKELAKKTESAKHIVESNFSDDIREMAFNTVVKEVEDDVKKKQYEGVVEFLKTLHRAVVEHTLTKKMLQKAIKTLENIKDVPDAIEEKVKRALSMLKKVASRIEQENEFQELKVVKEGGALERENYLEKKNVELER